MLVVALAQTRQVVGYVGRRDVADLRTAGRLKRAGVPGQVTAVSRESMGGQPALDRQVIEVAADCRRDSSQRSASMAG